MAIGRELAHKPRAAERGECAPAAASQNGLTRHPSILLGRRRILVRQADGLRLVGQRILGGQRFRGLVGDDRRLRLHVRWGIVRNDARIRSFGQLLRGRLPRAYGGSDRLRLVQTRSHPLTLPALRPDIPSGLDGATAGRGLGLGPTRLVPRRRGVPAMSGPARADSRR